MYDLTPYPITPIGNFLGFILALLPLFSQIRKLSIAIWGYALWVAVGDITTFVNTIIWHDNEVVVVPVWCDIVTKLQLGASIGIRSCALVLCIRLFRITRLRPSSLETTKRERNTALAFELILIIALPVLVMALDIIIQPVRFEILQEEGCAYVEYSYVGYIIYYAPGFILSLISALLAPWTLRTFFRHRKEMGEYLSSNQDITTNKYKRLMAIALLDTIFNLPVLIIILVASIASGKNSPLNSPYLSTILQTSASSWSTSGWTVFDVKWDEWLYVLHAVIFFSVFGTTPEVRHYYRLALWFVPERFGYKQHRASVEETVSDLVFEPSATQRVGRLSSEVRRRGTLSSLETTLSVSSTPPSAGKSSISDGPAN
ncbi:STE3-domain-containing protein [Schizopora paradoxa]|uniref:STE3-domain-containing protein n=1 Tax=Schizopora paradoxa TaxID=27342 RepID=A0A0H2R3U8_9AGAM|nr:STE3-domain-containing protein [Schizopora paradoxa]